MEKFLTKKYLPQYLSSLNLDINALFSTIQEKEWSADNFRFYTAVSVMSSAKIEGETLEVDSYVKHKLLNIDYLPNLTEKPNDLYKAYEFARDKALNLANFLEAHSIATEHLLLPSQRGKVRKGNMLIMEEHTNRIQYEAANAYLVQQEFDAFWEEVGELMDRELNIAEVFYFAALIHLVFVKIHPFDDGNGRTARLLEKWFIAIHLGEKAWYIGSESYYYQNLKMYYQNLARTGLFYDELDYEKGLSFLLMLPNALIVRE